MFIVRPSRPGAVRSPTYACAIGVTRGGRRTLEESEQGHLPQALSHHVGERDQCIQREPAHDEALPVYPVGQAAIQRAEDESGNGKRGEHKPDLDAACAEVPHVERHDRGDDP